eukprot:scaffold805_cov45-Attheya_sp.AAC.4
MNFLRMTMMGRRRATLYTTWRWLLCMAASSANKSKAHMPHLSWRNRGNRGVIQCSNKSHVTAFANTRCIIPHQSRQCQNNLHTKFFLGRDASYAPFLSFNVSKKSLSTLTKVDSNRLRGTIDRKHLNQGWTRRWTSNGTNEDNYVSVCQLSDGEVEKECMDWIQRVVVGLNLCPFADKPMRQNKLKAMVVRGTDPLAIATAIVEEMLIRTDSPGTTVIISPDFFPHDFSSYLNFVQELEGDAMEKLDLHGKVQLAPFHPNFEFDGSGPDGVDNLTNRAPHPIFHILREEEVSQAVDKIGGDASRVWQRNVNLLDTLERELGRDAVNQIMKGVQVDGVAEILKRQKRLTEDTDD